MCIRDRTVTVPETAKDSYTMDVDFGWYVVDEITPVEGTHSAVSYTHLWKMRVLKILKILTALKELDLVRVLLVQL